MATYYVDNDVGLTGGTGTQADPFGIETAIAAALPGDTFYWRGGGAGDAFPGHTLNFNKGGSSLAPVRWIGTDDLWSPVTEPVVGVDGDEGSFPIVEISANHQVFEGIRVRNGELGAAGTIFGWHVNANYVMLRHCHAHACGTGFFNPSTRRSVIFLACHAFDVETGFHFQSFDGLFHACVARQVTGVAFKSTLGGAFLHCRAWDVGDAAFEFRRDSATGNPNTFTVDHASVYDCTDGVRINAFNGVNPNLFSVTNGLFEQCSGYAVNVTNPTGQPGIVVNNGGFNLTGGQIPSGRTGLIEAGWLALPASPFVNPAAGDLSLVRSTPAIGAALDGGDLGALQRKHVRARAMIGL